MASTESKFHSCVRSNDQSAVQAMLSEGVSLNCVYYAMTPLLVATEKGHTEIAIMLIEKGCDVKKTDLQNNTSPFQLAVTKDNVKVVRALVKAGADPNEPLASGETPLTYAAHNKLTSLTQALIESGCNVNGLNKSGLSPLYIASTEGFSDITEKLLTAGADKNRACTEDCYTPLMTAILNERMSVVRLLIKTGVNLNAQDCVGWTALYHAVCDSNEKVVRMLLSAGACKDVKSHEDRTPLQEAQDNEQEDIIELLTKK